MITFDPEKATALQVLEETRRVQRVAWEIERRTIKFREIQNRIKELESALHEILRQLEHHPCKNEEIVEEVMNGKYDLCEQIGGDEASISEWIGIARKALCQKTGSP